MATKITFRSSLFANDVKNTQYRKIIPESKTYFLQFHEFPAFQYNPIIHNRYVHVVQHAASGPAF